VRQGERGDEASTQSLALAAPVTLRLSAVAKPGSGFFGGATVYELTVENHSAEDRRLHLDAEAEDGRFSFKLPDTVDVEAGSSATLRLEARRARLGVSKGAGEVAVYAYGDEDMPAGAAFTTADAPGRAAPLRVAGAAAAVLALFIAVSFVASPDILSRGDGKSGPPLGASPDALPPLTLNYLRQRQPGDLAGAPPDLIYHEIAVGGFDISDLDNLSAYVRVLPPLHWSVAKIAGIEGSTANLLVSFTPEARSNTFEVSVSLPDRRQANVSFEHRQPLRVTHRAQHPPGSLPGAPRPDVPTHQFDILGFDVASTDANTLARFTRVMPGGVVVAVGKGLNGALLVDFRSNAPAGTYQLTFSPPDHQATISFEHKAP
jgi:hypothetical protein